MHVDLVRKPVQPHLHKGRAATINPASRFDHFTTEAFDDGWRSLDEVFNGPAPRTQVFNDTSRSVIATNDSPDIPFDRSINPYRGCEHGCVYCYARPTHNYLGMSSGLDFETKIWAKHDVAALLKKELSKRNYTCQPMALGTNTDPYQPLERRLQLTRAILEVLAECNHPVGIVTKSSLVLRDFDILKPMAAQGLARVYISITTLDRDLARKLEPRATAPHRRLETLRMLHDAGIPGGVMAAPMIPALNDHELENILKAATDNGAQDAFYSLLRLPHDVKDLFNAWLSEHYPDRRNRILKLVKETRGGRLNDSAFGQRFLGTGNYASLLSRRFKRACRQFGLNQRRMPARTDLFQKPGQRSQFDLFG